MMSSFLRYLGTLALGLSLACLLACGGGGVTPTPLAAPTIATQPLPRTVTVGDTATFSVVAQNATSYQWYEQNTAIPGATGASYTTPATTTSMDSHLFKVIATGPGGNATSASVALTVQYYAITAHPQGGTVADGQTAALTATGTGNPATATYQWQRQNPGSSSAVDIASATNASYTTPTLAYAADDGAKYRRKDVHATGTYFTNWATLTVSAVAPAIVTEPQDRSVQTGQATNFSFTYNGTIGTVQWYRKPLGGTAAAIAGATATTYPYTPSDVSESGDEFYATVTNLITTATTRYATLTVTPAPVAPHFTTQPQDQTGHLGQTVTFSATASGVPTPTYAWKKNGGTVSGETTASLSVLVSSLSQDNDHYVCVANNGVGGDVASDAATLHALPALVAPWFTTSASNQAVTVGSNVTFTWAAGGNPTPTGAIQEKIASTWITLSSGFSLTLNNVQLSDSGRQFRCVATNSEGNLNAPGVTLTVNPVTYTLAYSVDTHGSLTGTVSQIVNAGGNGTAVTAVANTGYHFVNWSDGSTANPRTDTNVQTNVAVTANFGINTYTVTFVAGTGVSSLTGTTSQSISHGGSGSAVTAVMTSGYTFTNWTGTGFTTSTANPLTVTNVTSNLTITATGSPTIVVPDDLTAILDGTTDTGQYNSDRITSADPKYLFTAGANTTGIQMDVDSTGWMNLGLVSEKVVAGLADGTHSISFRAMNGATPSAHTADLTVTIMKTAPGKSSESFPNLDTANASGSGTMTLTQAIPAGYGIVSAIFIDANTSNPLGGTVTATANGTNTVSVSYTTPNLSGDTKIRLVVRNVAGAQRTVDSNTYNLF